MVGFEDTNLMGNVYFSNFISWQGKCREMFIKEKAGDLLEVINAGKLALITLHCSCNFLSELSAFDSVEIHMELESIQQNRIRMSFEYFKAADGAMTLVATGIHEIGCFKRSLDGLDAIPVPKSFEKALDAYTN